MFQDQKSSVLLIESKIIHNRKVKPQHNFSYNCISILLNLEKLPLANKHNIFFSINKNNFFSWFSKDHGDGKNNLIDWARKQVSNEGGDASGKILLHSFPRIFGRAFNPLSVYFCFDKNDCLNALIYEVRNTFGGIHSYVGLVKNKKSHKTKKEFLVSPFLPSKGEYYLSAKLNNNNLKISVKMTQQKKEVINAIQVGKIKNLTTLSLFYGILNGSALPGKPFVGILIEAARLWFKGAKYKSIISDYKHRITSASQRIK